MIKALTKAAAVTMLFATIAGCAYGGVAASGDKVVVARNDMFLFGALRTVFVCKITDKGLSGCSDSDSP
ncbi:MAG: hypothetical protein JRI68_14410 [Deltaproteobacteria bacterium]|nr:hypothetical protein [Deltaproteobacteria bacterium]